MTYLEDSLVDVGQEEDEQVQTPHLLLQTVDVGYAGKCLQVLSGQQGRGQISERKKGDNIFTITSLHSLPPQQKKTCVIF